MTDYLGPLAFGTIADGGTYALKDWSVAAGVASVTVTVRASSEDALAAALEALAAQLQVGNTYAHFQPGVTSPVVYSVLGASDLAQSGEGTWHAHEQRVSFTLDLAGAPAGALTTLYNAQAVSTPSSVALSALLGTNPTLLDVTVDDASALGLHSVWCALAPTALKNAELVAPAAFVGAHAVVYASNLTWTTLTPGTGATWWGNVMATTTSSAYQTANLDTSKYPAGKYRLLARVQQSGMTGGVPGYVMDSQNAVAVPVTRSSPHLVVVGDLDLPSADTALGTAANLTLSVKSNGTDTLTVNAFVLLPLGDGYFSWHHSTDSTEMDQLDVGPSGTFVDGVCDATHVRGGILAPGVLAAHTGTLVATASPTGSAWPADWGRTDDSTVTADTARFKFVVAGTAGEHMAWWPLTTALCPLVTPGTWLELLVMRNVSAFTSGVADVRLYWYDVDGNTVFIQTMNSAGASDASPVALTLYAKVPVHAVRVRVMFGAGAGATLTAYYSAVTLRRCPLKLIVIAEEAWGVLVNYVTPVNLTVKYAPRYEIAR